MRIIQRIAASLGRLWSLLSQKEKTMSDQTVIDPTSTTVASASAASAQTSSPAEDFANEIATAAPASVAAEPAATEAAPAAAPEAVPAAPTEASPPAAAEAVPAAAAQEVSQARQDVTEGVKDFAQAFSFVEQGVIKLGDAAKDELIDLARKYL